MYFHMKLKQGSDYEVSFTTIDADTQQPIDLRAEYEVTGLVAKSYSSKETDLYVWSASEGNVELLNGSLKIKVPGVDSALWSFRRVIFDIKIRNTASGKTTEVAYGPLTVIPSL